MAGAAYQDLTSGDMNLAVLREACAAAHASRARQLPAGSIFIAEARCNTICTSRSDTRIGYARGVCSACEMAHAAFTRPIWLNA
jgi:hypothetical protein